MLDHQDAREHPRGIHAHEHLDRPVVAALERLEFGGPKHKTCNILRGGVRPDFEGFEVWRIALFGGE
jgi:hypothetical protein